MSHPFSIGSSGDRNTSSTIGQANGNSYNNNGHVFNVTVAGAQNGGADGLSNSQEQQQQQHPLQGLMQLLNPFAMLGMLLGGGGGGGNFLKMG